MLFTFVTIVAETERAQQARSVDSYYRSIVLAMLSATAWSLVLQEGFKVILITVVSPHIFPDIGLLQRSPVREAIRVVVKGLLGGLYLILRML